MCPWVRLEEVFSDIVDLLRSVSGADMVWMEYASRTGQVRLLQNDEVLESPPLLWPQSASRVALESARVVVRENYDLSRVVPCKESVFFSCFVSSPLELPLGRIVVSVGWHQERLLTEQDHQMIKLATKLGGAALENAVAHGELQTLYGSMIRGLLSALEMRDIETVAHSRRVVTYTLLLAEQMGVAEQQFSEWALGAALHDVGKIAISDAILRKPGKLTRAEFALIRQHPLIGYDMLRGCLSPFPTALDMVRHHHERYDGTGYPARLAGQGIPFAARVLALADAFDVITHDRPYQRARSLQEAVEEVQAHRGRQFCPECMEAFFSIDTALLDAVRRGELDLTPTCHSLL